MCSYTLLKQRIGIRIMGGSKKALDYDFIVSLVSLSGELSLAVIYPYSFSDIHFLHKCNV